MKKVLVYLMIVIPFLGCSQTNFNEITLEEFHNISFNNITLSQLLEFDGNVNDLSNLFGLVFTDITHQNNDEGKDYYSPSILINYFEDELGGIEIKTTDIILSINGVNVSIGDNISLLGYGGSGFNSFVSPNDNTKGITIFKPDYNDTYISIYFNKSTGVINEVRYMSPT